MGTLTDEIRHACINEIHRLTGQSKEVLGRLSWTDLYRQYFILLIEEKALLTAPPTLLESDILTNTSRWNWAAFGYGFPGKSFLQGPNTIGIEWNATPTQSPDKNQMGFVNTMSNLIPGHSYLAKATVQVPPGSLPVRLSHAFTRSSEYTKAFDTDITLTLHTAYSTAKGFGIESSPAPGDTSCIVVSLAVYDVTPAVPYDHQGTSTLLRTAYGADPGDSVSTILRQHYGATDAQSLQDAAYEYWRNL